MWWMVGLGGALGAVSRYLLMGRISHWLGSSFPYGTLIINISGSFLMGVLIALLARSSFATMELRAFLAVGVLGGYTTFSSFSLDVVTMIERGELWPACVYVASSVFISIIAIFVGIYVIRSM